MKAKEGAKETTRRKMINETKQNGSDVFYMRFEKNKMGQDKTKWAEQSHKLLKKYGCGCGDYYG